ncbi:MAG: Uma2 family endonuclease [Acidobacteriaceae bacterium]|nr:Uma2 family endonuclease [Acidobacteriaceae bacterium]
MVVRPEDYERMAQSGGYFEGRPLFVIEVISPTECKSRRMQKIGLYLEAGTGAVVEIDYTKHSASIYRPDEDAPEVVHDRISSPFSGDLSDLFPNIR